MIKKKQVYFFIIANFKHTAQGRVVRKPVNANPGLKVFFYSSRFVQFEIIQKSIFYSSRFV